MIEYIVTPEMEVERIFNNLRYKYLKSIFLSELDNPHEFINAKYNNAFQSLAGINVYQGAVKNRKDNDDFWKDIRFKNPSVTGVSFDNEKNEMKFILNYIRHSEKNNFSRIYAELIAIKPGFHELYVHSDYFDKKTIPKALDTRSETFRLLRCFSDLETSELNKLDRLPPEINSKSYLTYASCNITEGPFVFRKSIDVSYFDEIRKIRSEDAIKELEKSFYIFDFYHGLITSAEELGELLESVEEFKGFIL